jgi:hypothetical protein
MADEQRQEPTERTPKGYEVRVPERNEFFRNLKKAAKPDKLTEQIEARRNDPESQRQLADAMERNKEALDLLARGDEDQEDL